MMAKIQKLYIKSIGFVFIKINLIFFSFITFVLQNVILVIKLLNIEKKKLKKSILNEFLNIKGTQSS